MEHNQIQEKTLSADHTFEGVSSTLSLATLCENERLRDKQIISGTSSSSSSSIYEFALDVQKFKKEIYR